MSLYCDCFKSAGRFVWWVLIGVAALVFILFLLILFKNADYYTLSAVKDNAPSMSGEDTKYIYDFSIYKDFVTTITGLLTLIIGAVGIGAYISLKTIREEEKKITERRKQLDMFLKIEEARNMSESEEDPTAKIIIYNDAEKDCSDFYMLYVLRGESYFYRRNTGDMLNAIKDFHKAIKLQDNSARAWFGLGQARFKLAMATSTVNNVGVRNVYGRPASSLTIADSYGLVLPSKKADVESAIGNIEKAISLQYAAAPARLQLGDMYRSLGDKEEALVQYREAYKSNKDHAACGFKYGLYWLIVNADNIENNYEEVIDILKKASVSDVFNSKAAYALLWYLFERIPGLGDAKKALAMTDPLVVNDIFELRIS